MYTFCVFHQHSYISYYIYNRYKILLVNFFPLSLSLIIFVKLHSIVNYFFFFLITAIIFLVTSFCSFIPLLDMRFLTMTGSICLTGFLKHACTYQEVELLD